ncbi:11451_t:CDS:2, partial [Gigaspora margarita]
MSAKDLEIELNKIKGYSRNKWNNLVDRIAKKGALDNNISIVDFQKRKLKLYKRAWYITYDNQIVETQAYLAICKGYKVKWQEIESQVFQILWNSLEQNLQRKISLDKLTSWLYDEIQSQKEAIRKEIIRNLTRKKTKQTFYKACPELKRLEGEDKGAPSKNSWIIVVDKALKCAFNDIPIFTDLCEVMIILDGISSKALDIFHQNLE